jgi:hypothetical protein
MRLIAQDGRHDCFGLYLDLTHPLVVTSLAGTIDLQVRGVVASLKLVLEVFFDRIFDDFAGSQICDRIWTGELDMFARRRRQVLLGPYR